jgi:hypothetical protein
VIVDADVNATAAIQGTKLADAPNGIPTAKLNDGAVTDAKIAGVAYSKVTGTPTALPPSGAASGDLGGTYPGPTIAKLNGATVGTTTPLARGDVLVANATPALTRLGLGANGTVLQSNGTDVVWDTPLSGPPSGTASGDLTGTYPAPTIGALKVTDAKINDVAATKLTGTIAQARFPVAPSGLLTANVNDGQVTFAKLAADAKPWTAGTTIAPTDPSKTVALAPVQNALQWDAGRLVKGRLIASAAQDHVQLSMNRAADGTEDDGTKPGWFLSLGPGDLCTVARAPAGSLTGTVMATVTATGAVIAAGDMVSGGTISTGGVATAPTSPGVRVTGTGAGLRCQGVGTAVGDGYSNAIAFGWDGTLKARVDTTVIGTVTVTSDKRLKIDVAEDVPGLDAVRAFRPISFAYDQTKRTIGFPSGRHYGLVAQEVRPHAPLVVSEDESPDHWQEIDYRALVPVLIQAIKDLAGRVAALETAVVLATEPPREPPAGDGPP